MRICFYYWHFVYKELKISDLPGIFNKTAKTTAIALFVLCVAAPFAWLMTSAGLPTLIANAVLSSVSSKLVIYALMLILLLFLGCFIDTQSIILLTTPILVPIMTNLGMSPVALGVIIVVAVSVGMITPPMATNLFLANSIVGLKGMGPIARSIIPYLVVEIAILTIITYFSEVIIFLPKILGMSV